MKIALGFFDHVLAAYKCNRPIDAAAYIGVTFDITKGYSMQGFRGKLVKPWCREMQQYKGFYDVPDGMHVQGQIKYHNKIWIEATC